jgi:hypothetical protein
MTGSVGVAPNAPVIVTVPRIVQSSDVLGENVLMTGRTVMSVRVASGSSGAAKGPAGPVGEMHGKSVAGSVSSPVKAKVRGTDTVCG